MNVKKTKIDHIIQLTEAIVESFGDDYIDENEDLLIAKSIFNNIKHDLNIVTSYAPEYEKFVEWRYNFLRKHNRDHYCDDNENPAQFIHDGWNCIKHVRAPKH